MSTSEKECIEALKEAAEKLGKSPTKPEYEQLGLTPASATIIRNVGGWNRAKKLAGLETNPSRGSRTQPKPDDVNLPDRSEWEELTVDQRWHYKNAKWNWERTRRRRARHRRWLFDIKQESEGCSRCGERNPACLDFHHRKDEDRFMPVNKLVPYGYGKERIREEIAKCDLLCANCHRKHHARPFSTNTRQRRVELRYWVLEQKAESTGCILCEEDNPHCLDFHHLHKEEKTRSVSQLINYEVSKDELKEEMDKCELLFANCHRKEHLSQPLGSESSQG